MTTVTLTSSEVRHSKAILLAADSGQWLRPDRLIDGRRAAGIPSQSKRGLYHWTDGVTCSCYDFRRRLLPCKHAIAFKLDAIARPHQPQPASDVVDGLAAMVSDRERQNSQTYADIFERFDDGKVARTAYGTCAVCGGEDHHDLDTHRGVEARGDLSRILGRRQRGVIPAHLIERED